MIDISTTLLTLIPFSHFLFLKSNLFLRNAQAHNAGSDRFPRSGNPTGVARKIASPLFLKKSLKELRRASRNYSRKQKGSALIDI